MFNVSGKSGKGIESGKHMWTKGVDDHIHYNGKALNHVILFLGIS